MSTPIIRPGRPTEIERVCEIALLAWEPIYEYRRSRMEPQMFDDLFGDWRATKAHEIRRLCETHPDRFFVAERERTILGFATFLIEEGKSLGIVGNNAVHPAAQGQGLGKRLHQRVLEEFRRRGLKYAQVLTGLDPAHDAARASYLKEGFQLSIEYGIFHQKL